MYVWVVCSNGRSDFELWSNGRLPTNLVEIGKRGVAQPQARVARFKKPATTASGRPRWSRGIFQMKRNQKFAAIFFFIVGLVASCSILLIVPLGDTLVQTGIVLGILAGIILCIIIELKNIRLMGKPAIEKNSSKYDFWIGLTVVGGVALARFVGTQFGERAQNFLNSFIFSWLIIFSFFVVYWMWKNKSS